MPSTHYTLRLNPLLCSYQTFHRRWWGHWFNPKTYWRFIKHFVQRGWRGYADNDHWDMDSYLEVVLLGLIKDLRTNTQGYDYPDADIPEGCEDRGAEKWDRILAEIQEGLEASRELKLEETVPEGVYGNVPLEELLNGSSSENSFNQDLYEQWAGPLRKKRRRAAILIVKHWDSLWD